MANLTWIGGATAAAQVVTLTLGGTWEADDVLNLTMYDEAGAATLLSTVSGSTTIATICTTLAAAVNAVFTAGTTANPFYAVSAVAGSTTVTLTARTAGVPFYVLAATTETGGGGADTQTFVKAISTPNSGPNDIWTAANWSTGAVPVGSDNVYADCTSSQAMLYGLYQNTSLTTTNSITLTLLRLEQGCPAVGTLAAPLNFKVTTLDIGDVPPDGTTKTNPLIVNLKLGNVACAGTIRSTRNSGSSGRPPVQISCANSSSVFTVLGSSLVGFATSVNGETATVGTITVKDTARASCGAGLTLTTINAEGGTALLSGAVTTIAYGKGAVSVSGSGNITTATIGSTFNWDSSGTITTLNVDGNGVANCYRGTITNCNLYGETSKIDASISGIPLNCTFTNGIELLAGASSTQVDFGDNVKVTQAAP
jgi:hypothetical protein